MMTIHSAGARWNPPDPRDLPEWRARMVEHTLSVPSMASLREAVRAGRFTVLPIVPGADVSAGSDSAFILARSEAHRLSEAALYYATGDMTSLALAAASTPPGEAVTLGRPPSPSGLIVFAEPIGGYTEDAAAALTGTLAHRPGASAMVTTPIVAASWSTWTPEAVAMDGRPGTVRWYWQGQGTAGQLPAEYEGIWVTWYSPRGLFSGLAPETVIGSMRDGSPMTAGEIDSTRDASGPPLQWDNEQLLTVGARFGPPPPDTTAEWSHVLYTAWQLMAQDSRNRWTEVEEVPRDRSGRKRDAREGITGPGTVRVVRVHTAHRPPARAAEEDAEQSTGRRAPHWSCRWPVRPHRRSHCMRPAEHADGGCTHEDRIIPGHVKGPTGAPLRTGTTVHLWDRQPEA